MDSILLLIFLVTLLVACFPYLRNLKNSRDFRKIFNKIPGPPAYPIFGTILPYIRSKREGVSALNEFYELWNCFCLFSDRFALTVELAKKYGPIYRMWIGNNFPEVRVMQCDLAEEIFRSSKHIEKSPTYDLLRPWLGEGLISSTGKWEKSKTKINEWKKKFRE